MRRPSPRVVILFVLAMIVLSSCQRITLGTTARTSLDMQTPANAGLQHGTRVYCPVSHFNYDDPVVLPGQPRQAHLHMFWGNTATDAFTTPQSLAQSNRTTCEGGRNNLSAYWAPALFNSRDEVVLPEKLIVYYKSFASTSGFNRNTIQPIPNGLQMLAHPNIANSVPRHFTTTRTNDGLLKLVTEFPTCLAVNGAGNPILSSANNSPNTISHLSYAVKTRQNSNDCPNSHPYRIPQLIYSMQYDVDINSRWYLASDTDRNRSGHSLHADYISMWDSTSMNRLVQCQVEERQACQFKGPTGRSRNQLVERFVSPAGQVLYNDSISLRSNVDRTPFSTGMKPLHPSDGHQP